MADNRTYIKVHDGMPDHPKVEPLSDAAFRLLVTTWCWCSRHLTDGHISARLWAKRGTARARRELIDAGLAEVLDDGGILVHDYLEHQRSAEQVEELREAKGKGAKFGNHVRWHVRRGVTDPECDHCSRTTDPDSIADGSQDRSVERDGKRSRNGNGARDEDPVIQKNERDSESSADDTSDAPSSEDAENAVANGSHNRSQTGRKTSPETTTEEVLRTSQTETEPIPPSAGREDAPRAEGGTSIEQPDTAQALVADWIDHVPKRPPNNVIGQVSKHLKAMLAEGIDPTDVRRGLATWAGKGLHPSTLPSVVNEVMNTTPARVGIVPSTTDLRVAQAQSGRTDGPIRSIAEIYERSRHPTIPGEIA